MVVEVVRRRRSDRVDVVADGVPTVAAASSVARRRRNDPVDPVGDDSSAADAVEAETVGVAAADVEADGGGAAEYDGGGRG